MSDEPADDQLPIDPLPIDQLPIDEVPINPAPTEAGGTELRERIRKLIQGLPLDHPARIEGEREIVRLDKIAYVGEVRGHAAEPGLTPLPSLGRDSRDAHASSDQH